MSKKQQQQEMEGEVVVVMCVCVGGGGGLRRWGVKEDGGGREGEERETERNKSYNSFCQKSEIKIYFPFLQPLVPSPIPTNKIYTDLHKQGNT